MRTSFFYRTGFLAAASALLGLCLSSLGQTSAALGRRGPEWEWSKPTNGIAGGISVTYQHGLHHDPQIGVYLRQSGGSETVEASGRKESMLYFGGEVVVKSPGYSGQRMVPQYFMATNGFCGLIELVDALGQPVQMTRPEGSDPGSYPVSYNVQRVQADFTARHVFYSGPPMPMPLMSLVPQLAYFRLGDYFDLKRPGRYKLTVWAKVYKRSSKDPDVCKRIDVPSVSATIEWSTEQESRPQEK